MHEICPTFISVIEIGFLFKNINKPMSETDLNCQYARYEPNLSRELLCGRVTLLHFLNTHILYTWDKYNISDTL